MNLLFIHNNFPGQFDSLARFLAKRSTGRTLFLTQSDNPQSIQIPGVDLVRFQVEDSSSQGVNPYLKPMEKAVRTAQAVLQSLVRMKKSGFVPDVVAVSYTHLTLPTIYSV